MHACYVSGWCSAQPGLSMRKYTIPFVDLSVGDVCLPPNHPEAVRTPTGDICDRFRRFEFDEQHSPLLAAAKAPLTPAAVTKTAAAASSSPPPASPAKLKKESSSGSSAKDENKPKRPMNGFMLFAKKFRLELIQQHPGKDNR